MTMRAAVYLRQSMDREGDGLAVERQREDCLRICRERGWEPTQYVDNDTSASKGRRPSYERMLADIRSGRIDAVVVWDLDRLHRQPKELEQFIELADEKRLALATVGGDADLSTDNGRLFARIKGAVARAEVERKSARQKRAFLQMAQSGKGWGPRAFGYNGDHDKPKIILKEAEALRRGYKMLLSGETLYSVAKHWNDAGLKTPRGNLFNGTTVRRILQNPRYAAVRTYHDEVVGEGKWPAIIDETTWQAVNALLSDPSRHQPRQVRKYVLGGLLTCSECGHKMSVGVQHRKEGNVPIYRCKHVSCGKVTRRVERMDEWVREIVLRRMSSRHWVPGNQDNRERALQLREELDTIKQRMDSLAIDFADGELTASQMRIANERMQAKLDDVEDKLRRTNVRPIPDGILTAKDRGKFYDDQMSLDAKRALIEALCNSIVVHPLNLKGRSASQAPLGHNIDVHWHKPSNG
ncbi:site-specific recombinase, DNA invertase Pin [Mycobacteroides abscessus subsp. massiliense]|nr:site-specific recombinase, DNA invertase Pin [Mycobacteroides abscessus subsp. massiliense]SKU97278.1 site-specific recombinase, DNA invertase Pin [Mycobacteroides abscessus subsp. massiliense]SLH91404.1 site-specific recombinase, DNA invertase Pin [Mycobacteroides abscessus subsp. massiliense]SLI31619.1 site-specific recombinase, DNA invertase Pin [Mycobacteroides abscessus subsp. massiliense]